MKGALDVVLRHCSTLPSGCVLRDVDRDHFQKIASDFGYKGLRGGVLGVWVLRTGTWS